jgi:hypothetical protein
LEEVQFAETIWADTLIAIATADIEADCQIFHHGPWHISWHPFLKFFIRIFLYEKKRPDECPSVVAGEDGDKGETSASFIKAITDKGRSS